MSSATQILFCNPGLSEELLQMQEGQQKRQQKTEEALRQMQDTQQKMAEMLASLGTQRKALAGSQVPSPVDI